MIKLKFLGFKHPNHPKPNEYRGPSGEWKKGDVVEVEDKEAERLLKDFADTRHGAAFERTTEKATRSDA